MGAASSCQVRPGADGSTLQSGNTDAICTQSQSYYSVFSSQSTTKLCDGTPSGSVTDIFPKGISSTTLVPNSSSGKIDSSILMSYVSDLVNQGLAPGIKEKYDEQVKADTAFFLAVRNEYCFYETRYKSALGQFLDAISAPGIDTKSASFKSTLQRVIDLNVRLNSILEIVVYIGNDRARHVNQISSRISTENAGLSEKVEKLKAQRDFLQTGESHIRTQEEMIRYTAEKNASMNNQVIGFVLLNILAVGVVLTVYSRR
jgi:hypothetical protein